MEEIEAKIQCLKEEELAFLGWIESGYKEELNALHRDAETKEAKLAEWCSKHVKLAKLVDQIGLVHTSHGFTALQDMLANFVYCHCISLFCTTFLVRL